MLVLLSDSAAIIARFHDTLMEKGVVNVIDSPSALWQRLSGVAPGLIVLDLGLSSLDAAFALSEIRRLSPASKVLVLQDDFSTSAELALLGAGVAGCCSARLTHDTIIRIIDMVLDGGVWISHAVMPLLLQQMQERGTLSAPVPVPVAAPVHGERLINLTPRERQIARLIGSGVSNKLIARELSITDRTVKAHLGAIFQKLGLSDRLQLALFVTGK
ncbi:response regulator transcription factor [Actimicrobium antarcticum]